MRLRSNKEEAGSVGQGADPPFSSSPNVKVIDKSVVLVDELIALGDRLSKLAEVILMISSFNESKLVTVWAGYSQNGIGNSCKINKFCS